MRPLWKDVLIAVWLGMILPGMVLNIFVLKEKYRNTQEVKAAQMKAAVAEDPFILVLNQDGTCVELALDEYLTGVLLAEIPADFHMEALKAQAVAARTYAWKAYTTGGKHGDGSLCTDSACCQAYLTEEAYFSHGGTYESLEKIGHVVSATSTMVLAYEGQLIEATYFSSAGGRTEPAVAVWGKDIPYLITVTSPEEILTDTVSYSEDEFRNLLSIPLTVKPNHWFGAVTYTEGGGVESMEISGKSYTGVQLRSILGLRSTLFRIHQADGRINIITRGYGHRVGMSQYGANAMAQAGSSWQKILQHYYPGTTLVSVY